jgi:hypothetical protein
MNTILIIMVYVSGGWAPQYSAVFKTEAACVAYKQAHYANPRNSIFEKMAVCVPEVNPSPEK